MEMEYTLALKKISIMKSDNTRGHYSKFSVNLCTGKQLKTIYINITKYHNVSDLKATFLRVSDSEQRLKNSIV